MKKITAFVLALVMTLSLLPMNVWAEGEQPLYFGDGPDDNLTYNSEFRADVNKQYTMRFFIDQNGTRVTNGGSYELSTEGNIGTFTANAWDCTWDTTNATDAEGYLKVKKETITYAMKVTVNLNPGGGGGNQDGGNQGGNGDPFTLNGVEIYTNKSQGVGTYHDWSTYDGLEHTTTGGGEAVKVYYRPRETCKLFLKPIGGITLTGIGGGFSGHANLGAIEESTGIYELTLNDTAEGEGNVWIDLSNNGNNSGFDIQFVPVGNQVGGDQGYLRSNTPVDPADILPTSAIPEDLDRTDFLGRVQIPDTEYYMSLIRHESGNLLDVKWDGNGLPERMQVDIQLAIGFYKWTGQTMELVAGDELANLVAAFGNTLKIELKLFTDDESNTAGIEYPCSNEIDDPNNVISKYPCSTEYVFNHYSQGKWLLVASGKYNGTDIVARGYTNKEEQLVTGVDASSMTTVTEINSAISDCIASLPENYNGRIAVELPAATLEGYIEVPAFGNEVMLNGKWDDNTGEIKTILRGGIIANSSDFHASCIQFIGAGRNSSATNNYAISGTARGGYDRCTFTGYDCAVYITHGLAGGENNFFYDNNVGIRVKDPDGLAVGNHQIYKTVFAYNGKDIEVLNADGESGETKHYAIWDTIFIGSEKNVFVDESLWEILFMPMNAFDDGTDADDEPIIEGRVSATPYYGLSPAGKSALYGMQDATARLNANYYLSHPTFNDEWIEHGKKFNSEWMCPERFDGDTYHIHRDHIIRGRGHMTIKMMGDRGSGHECVATITLKPAAGN